MRYVLCRLSLNSRIIPLTLIDKIAPMSRSHFITSTFLTNNFVVPGFVGPLTKHTLSVLHKYPFFLVSLGVFLSLLFKPFTFQAKMCSKMRKADKKIELRTISTRCYQTSCTCKISCYCIRMQDVKNYIRKGNFLFFCSLFLKN